MRNQVASVPYYRCSVALLALSLLSLITTANAQTTTTLVPSSYVTTSGTSGGQPVASSIDLLDESGATNTWAKYVEFQTTATANYAGYQVFTLPISIAPSSVTAIQVKVNYQGPLSSTQTWTWQLLNWSTNAYVTVGTNSVDTSGWAAWQILTFNATGTLANYVRASDGQMRVQLLSNNHADNVDIDYEALLVTYATTPVVNITISPTSASVQTSATQQFTATVTGSTNTAVTWQVNNVTGGNSTTGTVSTTGLYTAPAAVPSPAAVTVKAIAQADTTKTASATVTVTGVPQVSVSISPTSATVQTNATQQFTATVTGSTNTLVNWQVNGIAGGNSTVGTVTSGGLYAAPATVPSPASVTVTAVSQADATKSASAAVTVTAASGGGLNYYVAPTGSNTNPGTAALPWKTITFAISQATAGATIHVLAGTYNELVTLNKSGSAAGGYITLLSDPQAAAILDGTGLAIPNGQNGMVTISSQSYVIVHGFEIRNYTSSSTANVPVGIYVLGAGSNIQILNNHIHNIVTTASGCNANALGMAIYGNQAPASINNLTISGNELDHLKTGCSESMSLNGNVQYFTVTNNLIHDNNNIGIDAIGFEGTSPNAAYDQARDGTISGNTIYNITSYGNPAYGNQYAADGIYVDGGTRITVERNLIHNVDFSIELASEHSGKTSSYVIARSNIIYNGNASGITIGGYASQVGGTDHCTIVNNTLYNDDTKGTGSGEFQIQYHATNNVFENNIVYAKASGFMVNSFVSQTATTVDYNLYFSSVASAGSTWTWNGTSHTGFASWQSSTGNDAHSSYADPMFVSLVTPDLHVSASSPAVNTGNTSLGSATFGTLDYAGNARVQGSNVDKGAYEQ